MNLQLCLKNDSFSLLSYFVALDFLLVLTIVIEQLPFEQVLERIWWVGIDKNLTEAFAVLLELCKMLYTLRLFEWIFSKVKDHSLRR